LIKEQKEEQEAHGHCMESFGTLLVTMVLPYHKFSGNELRAPLTALSLWFDVVGISGQPKECLKRIVDAVDRLQDDQIRDPTEREGPSYIGSVDVGCDLRQLNEYLNTWGSKLQASKEPSVTLAPRHSKRRPPGDRLLVAASCLIPRKHREAIRGDLRRDLKEFRREGMSERQLCWFLLWQFGVILAPWLNPARWIKWTAVLWVAKRLAKMVGG
jgi:hypothetical protein